MVNPVSWSFSDMVSGVQYVNMDLMIMLEMLHVDN